MRYRLKQLLALLAVILLAVPSTLADVPIVSYTEGEKAEIGEGAQLEGQDLEALLEDETVVESEDEGTVLMLDDFLVADVNGGGGADSGLSEESAGQEIGGSETSAPTGGDPGTDVPGQTDENQDLNAPAQTGDGSQGANPGQVGEDEGSETNPPVQTGASQQTDPSASTGGQENPEAGTPAQTDEDVKQETHPSEPAGEEQKTGDPTQPVEEQKTENPTQPVEEQKAGDPAQPAEEQKTGDPAQPGDADAAKEGESSDPAAEGENPEESGEPAEGEGGEDAEANAAEQPPARLMSASLAIGLKEKRQLTVGGAYVGPGSGYWFASSNPKVVAVNGATGLLQGKKKGTAVVTLTGEGVSETCVVTVKKAPKKVKLNVKKLSLGVGMTYRLTGSLTKNSASALRFSSNKNWVASVDGNGVITARGRGTATITVKTFNGKKAKCKVTVVPAPTYVTFGGAEKLIGLGQTAGGGAGINPGTLAGITYTSEDPSILQVSGGWIRGAALGETTLTATTHNGLTASVKVRVLPAPTSLTLPSYTIYMGKKEKLYLRPAVNEGSVSSYSFATSKKKVATVNGAGMVTAKKKGTAVITIRTYNGLTARCTIKVVNVPKKVRLSPGSMTIGAGQSGRLYASLPKGTGSAVSFYSSNAGVASVDGSGTVRGVSAGTAVITARTFNGKTARSTVRVLPAPTSVEISLGSNRIDNGAGTSISARVNSGAAGSVTLTAEPADWVTLSGGRVTANAKGLAVGEHQVIITGTTYNGVSASVELTLVVRTKYRALLIGEKNFTNPNEVCARNEGDVKLMKSMLGSVHGPTGESYETIAAKYDLTASGVQSAIQSTFSGAGEEDVSLFFIATHGDSTSSGSEAGQLVMADGKKLTLSTLAGWLAKVNGKVIVVVEACGSGAAVKESASQNSIARKAASANAASSADAGAAWAKSFNAAVVSAFSGADTGVVVSANQASASGMRKAQKNAAAFVVENKFYVLTAADYQEDSWGLEHPSDSDTGYNYFTRWLTQGVGTSGSMPADGNKDSQVALQELYDYIVEVGNNTKIWYLDSNTGEEKYAYQHVQVYPANCDYALFKR